MKESFGERNILPCFGFVQRKAYESHKVLRRNLLQFLYREELIDFPKKKAQILEIPNKAYP